MSRRDQITLTPEERAELLDAERVVICTTNGHRGWPHSMPLWFVVREGEIWCWTYGKSQKIKNIERDPKATLLIETGDEYSELRGVQIEATAHLIDDPDEKFEFAKELTVRYAEGIDSIEGDAAEGLKAQLPKRMVIRFESVREASWDHRKLGGTY